MDYQTSRHTQSGSHEVYTAHLHRHPPTQTPPATLSTNVHLFRHPTPRHICTVYTSMNTPTSRHTQSGSHAVYATHLHRHTTIQTTPATLSTIVHLHKHPTRRHHQSHSCTLRTSMDNQISRHTQSGSPEMYTAHLYRHTTIQTPSATLSTIVHLHRHQTRRHH